MNITIKKARIDNLKEIQELNNQLFKLEYNNFDPALRVRWALEEEGTEYFTDMINNEVVFKR